MKIKILIIILFSLPIASICQVAPIKKTDEEKSKKEKTYDEKKKSREEQWKSYYKNIQHTNDAHQLFNARNQILRLFITNNQLLISKIIKLVT